MGNNGGISRLCQKTPVIQHNPDDILTTQYIVPCQICNTQFKHPALKEHIDLNHYATIRQEKDGNVVVQCILCGKLTSDLVQHGSHITEKHKYADVSAANKSKLDLQVVAQNVKQRKRTYQWQLNKTKKASAVKLQSEKDFQITKQVETNHYQASVNGISYDVVKYSKEYRGADYDEQLMKAELIWFNIFKQKTKCKYYYLDLEPGVRNILCKGYIFVAKNQ